MKLPVKMLVAAVALSSPAMATDLGGTFRYYDGVTCAQYTSARRDGRAADIQNWIAGWLTAYNRAADDTYDITGKLTVEGVFAWVDEYCEKNPDKHTYVAMQQFRDDHMATRYRTKEDADAVHGETE